MDYVTLSMQIDEGLGDGILVYVLGNSWYLEVSQSFGW